MKRKARRSRRQEAIEHALQSRLTELEDDIFSVCRGPSPPARLFHYTQDAGFDGILQSRELRLTHFRATNDDDEIRAADPFFRDLIGRRLVEESDAHVLAMLRGVLAQFDELRAANHLDVHIGCFSEASDSASQWREYGGQGSGYCLEFDLTELAAMHSLLNLSPGDIQRLARTSAPASGLDALQVVYRPVQQSILVHRAVDVAIRQLASHAAAAPEHGHRFAKRAAAALFRCAAALACQFKQPKWSHEHEWRLALISSPGQVLPPVTIPFRDRAAMARTPLRSVRVGPLGPGVLAVERRLAELEHPGVPVLASGCSAAACQKAAT